MIFLEAKTEPWAEWELEKPSPNEIEEFINSKLIEKPIFLTESILYKEQYTSKVTNP